MGKLKIFKTVKTEKILEKEIDLPAYFVYGNSKPSEYTFVSSYCNIVCISDEIKEAVNINLGGGYGAENQSNHHKYERSCWSVSEILTSSSFHQVDRSEWELAKIILMEEIKSI